MGALDISREVRSRRLVEEPLLSAQVAFGMPVVVRHVEDEDGGRGFVVSVEVAMDHWEAFRTYTQTATFMEQLKIRLHGHIQEEIFMGSLAALRWPG